MTDEQLIEEMVEALKTEISWPSMDSLRAAARAALAVAKPEIVERCAKAAPRGGYDYPSIIDAIRGVAE